MGLKDSIAFQQIALVVQSGLQGVCVWGGGMLSTMPKLVMALGSSSCPHIFTGP